MDSIILFDIDGTIVSENNPFVTYDDARVVLPFMKEKGYKLGLYSQGFPTIQKLKLSSKGLLKYFSPDLLFISHNKFETLKNKVAGLSDSLIVIDNDISQLEKVMKSEFSAKVLPIHLDRLGSNKDLTIKSLHELHNLLTSLNVVHKI